MLNLELLKSAEHVGKHRNWPGVMEHSVGHPCYFGESIEVTKGNPKNREVYKKFVTLHL